jgi:hypothetical protein
MGTQIIDITDVIQLAVAPVFLLRTWRHAATDIIPAPAD